MAILANHIELDETTSRDARNLMDCVRNLTRELAKLDDIFDGLAQMKTGDGSQASHFTIAAELFSVQAESGGGTVTEKCKVMHDEMNSAKGNSSALRQFLAYMGPS